MKIRDLTRILQRRGYMVRSGRGSHRVWTHPTLRRPIVLHGLDSDDAHPYQIARVHKPKSTRKRKKRA